MGIFNKSNQPDPKVNRNAFDLSFASSGTFKFGTLYPVFCKEVLPGDSFRINGAFGLRFMPLAFPIQTKVRADIHFFYVRNRNLWKDWPNFIGQTGRPSAFPVLSSFNSKKMTKTGSLGDYLGLPSTVVGTTSKSLRTGTAYGFSNPSDGYGRNVPSFYLDYRDLGNNSSYIHASFNSAGYSNFYTFIKLNSDTQVDNSKCFYAQSEVLSYPAAIYIPNYDNYLELHTGLPADEMPQDLSLFCFVMANSQDSPRKASTNGIHFISSRGEQYVDQDGLISYRWKVSSSIANDKLQFFFCFNDVTNADSAAASLSTQKGTALSSLPYFNTFSGISYELFYRVTTLTANDPVDELKTPISALPFRAYESVYNSFYRDQRNNPYIVNGVQDPNVYLPTTDGGSDNSSYDFRQRNWEQDFLTSAVPSPQQGVAPLVGITSTGVATFDVDGTPYSAQLETAEDGDTVVSARLGSDAPASVRSSVMSLATSGISINDFRGVNALQRFLETNMRRGLKYKDQIMSHYGVDVSYAELDMPEFLGGFSEFVNIDQINNMTESEGSSPLGSYAGQASCVGSSKHTINRFCDEHGFIIGIMSIVPVPTYSQLLPKHFTKFDPLDYFFPEFGHLGYQPIPYREVCPFQAQSFGVDLSSTFGYQRAWYDYLASVDEVHGLFRTQLQSFILTRVFNGVPSLNEDFLLVHPESLNDIFTVTKDSDGNPVDPILGQLYFDVTAKRKIPRYGVPRLE